MDLVSTLLEELNVKAAEELWNVLPKATQNVRLNHEFAHYKK